MLVAEERCGVLLLLRAKPAEDEVVPPLRDITDGVASRLWLGIAVLRVQRGNSPLIRDF